MLSRKHVAAAPAAVVQDVLAAHQQWVRTNGAEGSCADLRDVDLRERTLEGADLRQATLRRCNLAGMSLEGADLRGADLEGADLTGVRFGDANVKDARLVNARMESADLSRARHLKAGQLRGCDLSYASLPPHIDFYGLEQANQSLGRLAVQFVATLTVCVYSWLVIGSTTDVDLVTNASSVSVPFLELSLPILGFYLLVPLALVALSTAFYIHLQTYWDNVASLPAYFPDGCEMTARTPPTLLDRLIERHMTLLRRDKATPLSRVYASLISVGLFGVVPATLFLFWLRYLPRHDALGTGLQLMLLFGYLIYSWLLTVSMKAKLRMIPTGLLVRHSWWQLGFAIAICAILGYITFQVLYGPRMKTGLFYADLGGQRLSAKSGDPEVAPVRLTGMNLRHVNLAGALAQNADFSGSRLEHGALDRAMLHNTFLRDADLSAARLHRAELEGADLRRARMPHAILDNANLAGANLTQTDLRDASLAGASVARANFSRARLTGGANAHGISGEGVVFALAELSGAQLSRATLPKANFFLADLREVYLWRASLAGATFVLADLGGANLTQADLTGADLSQASLRGTILDRARLRNAKLVCAQLYDAALGDADLTGADLQSAQLRGAVLRNARLVRAHLGDASLEGTDLRGADLSDATGLTPGQIAQAVVDGTTILPPGLQPHRAAMLASSQPAARR